MKCLYVVTLAACIVFVVFDPSTYFSKYKPRFILPLFCLGLFHAFRRVLSVGPFSYIVCFVFSVLNMFWHFKFSILSSVMFAYELGSSRFMWRPVGNRVIKYIMLHKPVVGKLFIRRLASVPFIVNGEIGSFTIRPCALKQCNIDTMVLVIETKILTEKQFLYISETAPVR